MAGIPDRLILGTQKQRIDNTIKVKLDSPTMIKYKELEKQKLLELQEGDITATSAGKKPVLIVYNFKHDY